MRNWDNFVLAVLISILASAAIYVIMTESRAVPASAVALVALGGTAISSFAWYGWWAARIKEQIAKERAIADQWHEQQQGQINALQRQIDDLQEDMHFEEVLQKAGLRMIRRVQ